MPDARSYVLVTTDYPPYRGGVARYLGALVQGSSGRVRVLVPQDFPEASHVSRIRFFRPYWPKWWPLVRHFREIGRSTETLIISHLLPIGTAAWIAKRFGGAPYVLICHGLDVRLASRNFWKRWLATRILKGADRVIANSRSTAESVERFGVRAGIVYPGGALRNLPDRETARTRHGIEPNERVILAVARLVERKGIDRLIDALDMLPPADAVRLVVIGNGPELGVLKSLAQHSSRRINFLTDASDDALREWYAAADVFCLPVRESSDDVEGFGIVFIEAASAGLPVIAGRTGGAAEAVVDGETGLLVAPDDVREIARALTRVLGDSEWRKRMGEAGKARALREFTWDDRWQRFEQAISG